MRIHFKKPDGRYSSVNVPDFVVDAIAAVHADPDMPPKVIRAHAEHCWNLRPDNIPYSHYVCGLILQQCLRHAALLGPGKLSIFGGSSHD